MTARCFADTNIFLYAASKDPADRDKKKQARLILETEDIGLSVQVLQEFFEVATRRQRLGISETEACRIVERMLEFPLLPLTGDLVLKAIEIKTQYGISYWDAAIVAAAQAMKSELLYTEDLGDGRDYGNVVARNPFRR